MTIYYLGHFADYSGYGKAARDNVKLLDSLGYNVICGNISHDNELIHRGQYWVDRIAAGRDLPEEIDIFIVHKSPWNQDNIIERIDQAPAAQKAKQKIYYTVFETSRWPEQWKEPLSYFDKILTPSTWQKEAALALLGDGWKDKISVVPHIIEPTLHEPLKNEIFTFYSDFSRISPRKGLDILLKAYFWAFTNKDKVKLKLKLPSSDASRREWLKLHQEAYDCFRWKASELPIIEINESLLSDEQMLKNILECDCYVCPARGEGFAISLATAAVNGKPCLAPAIVESADDIDDVFSWHADYLSPNCRFHAEQMSVVSDEFWRVKMIINTDDMYWLEGDLIRLKQAMSHAVNHKTDFIPDSTCIDYLSAENVGKFFTEAFNA